MLPVSASDRDCRRPKTLPNVRLTIEMPSIVIAVASSIDLVTLDSLSRTCRQVHDALIQYRTMLLKSTVHCYREDMPVDPADTFRHRARAGNWYAYRDMDMRNFNGKHGFCARDMVGECRRCGVPVCRVSVHFTPEYGRHLRYEGRKLTHVQNCTIKQPKPAALKERHRRLCLTCTKTRLSMLINPLLEVPISSEVVQYNLCQCGTKGAWLCQPCGRTIGSADHDYLRYFLPSNHHRATSASSDVPSFSVSGAGATSTARWEPALGTVTEASSAAVSRSVAERRSANRRRTAMPRMRKMTRLTRGRGQLHHPLTTRVRDRATRGIRSRESVGG